MVRARGLAPFFTEVHGSPPFKPEIIEGILSRHALEAGRCLFFGDALTDQRAAAETGLRFQGVEPPGETHPFGADAPVMRELTLPSFS